MIKYHGTPITPKEVFNEYMRGKNILIPFTDKRDFERATRICNKIIIDNGAYSIWKRGLNINWEDYYNWIKEIHSKIEFYFIPDVIGGTEEENDNLINDWIESYSNDIPNGVPVWHTNESIDRLKMLSEKFDRVAFGSSGEFSKLGTPEWHKKTYEAIEAICDADGVPKVKIHMLRCLNKNIFKHYPFDSGDSTTFGQNHKKYHIKYKGRQYLLDGLERYDSPKILKHNKEIK